MSGFSEMDTFRSLWSSEADRTLRVLKALPPDQYDFRPDPKGRSIGELAWHLAEIDGCLSFGVAKGQFNYDDHVPDLKRPREIKELAPGYRRVHEQAVARLNHPNGVIAIPFTPGRQTNKCPDAGAAARSAALIP